MTTTKNCGREGCDRAVRAKGFCDTHYKHFRRWGDFVDHRVGRTLCTVAGCDTVTKAHGLCNRHYQRLLKHGDPLHERGSEVCDFEGCEDEARALGLCRAHYDRQRNGWSMAGRTEIRVCRMDRCGKPHHTKGLCQKHYRRWVKWGDPFFDGRHYVECSVPGCRRDPKCRGMCGLHYNRWHDHGDALYEPKVHVIQPLGVELPLDPIVRILRTFEPPEIVAGQPGAVALLLDAHRVPASERERIERYLARAHKRGHIDLAHADHFAVKVLGTHPALIWGEDYWDRKEFEEEMAA